MIWEKFVPSEVSSTCVVMQFHSSGATSKKTLLFEMFYQNIKLTLTEDYWKDYNEIHS